MCRKLYRYNAGLEIPLGLSEQRLGRWPALALASQAARLQQSPSPLGANTSRANLDSWHWRRVHQGARFSVRRLRRLRAFCAYRLRENEIGGSDMRRLHRSAVLRRGPPKSAPTSALTQS